MAKNYLTLGLVAILASCANMPTPVSEISTPIYTTKKYENFDCLQLRRELSTHRILEKELTKNQEKRIIDSSGHNFFYGWGKGDGMDTIELIKVKGETLALKKESQEKNCLAQPGISQ